MEVHVVSREVIKPSSTTPNHLRTYKLSRLDQMNIDIFIPIVFFYQEAPKNSDDLLKKSLSDTLTHYYPLAGRVKDCLYVDCDDYGISYVVARVDGDMSNVFKQPEFDQEEQLMPCKQHEMLKDQSILAVQVSHFGCGGVAICLLFRHVIVDGATAANFVKTWAVIASCGGNDDSATIIKDLVFDCTSIFPPRDHSGSSTRSSGAGAILFSSSETTRKRFIFEGSKISALQDKIGNRTTRFEAVFTLMWDAITAAKREGDDFVATIPVNLRKRMNPPIPEQCIGNILTIIQTNWPTEETINYSSLTEKVHELVSMVNDDYVKKAYPNGWILNRATNGAAGRDTGRRRLFMISSWCDLPLYKSDFGWGNPELVAPVGRVNSGDNISVCVWDTTDGAGIEAWMFMSKEEMAKFEQDLMLLLIQLHKNKHLISTPICLVIIAYLAV
ncbi:hypothetical protein ACOSP7_021824 [Xanthoceras sorbifolium]